MNFIKQLVVTGLLVFLLLGTAAAQDSALTADELRQFEPLSVLSGTTFTNLSPDGQYELQVTLISQQPGSLFVAQLLDAADGSLIHDFGPSSGIQFAGDSLVLWFGNPQNQQPTLYSLPDMEELGQFPLGAQVQVRQKGEGFLYVSDNSAFFQPLDMTQSPVLLADSLGYTEAYRGALKELPDGHTVLIAGQTSTILYDLETDSVSGEIVYPLLQGVTVSADGSRISAVTNYDSYTSMASNWLAYDLVSGEPLVELYGQRGAHGDISDNGKYGAVSQMVTDSRMGILHVYDLDTGEELYSAENIAHGGIPGQTGFLFLGDQLVFVREWNGQSGLLSIYDPATGDVTELDIPVLMIMDTFLRPFGVPVLSDISSMIEISTLEDFSIFDVTSLEVVRSFPTRGSYNPNNHTITIGNEVRVVLGVPTAERPALPTLVGSTQSQNINVRAQPSTNGERIGGANGEIVAVGRNADSTWVLLLSHGGWVSADLVTLDGDIETLTVIP